MPGGPEPVAFHSECWDYPELIVPPVLAGSRKERPVKVKTSASEEPNRIVEVGGPCKSGGKLLMAGTLLPGPTKVLPGSRSI